MKKFLTLHGTLLLILLLLPLSTSAVVQQGQSAASQKDLFRTVASLDSAVFDAFNRCDLEKFGAYFDDDLEFYHDMGGMTRSRQSLVESIKNNICGKVRRELVPGSLEVYPIAGYGAVEMGTHRFCEAKAEKCGEGSGTAKFVHLWQNRNGTWKITRVISYAH